MITVSRFPFFLCSFAADTVVFDCTDNMILSQLHADFYGSLFFSWHKSMADRIFDIRLYKHCRHLEQEGINLFINVYFVCEFIIKPEPLKIKVEGQRVKLVTQRARCVVR